MCYISGIRAGWSVRPGFYMISVPLLVDECVYTVDALFLLMLFDGRQNGWEK